ncbi:hypothetical protein Tco_0197789, partial [Tanacetum coccineum]
MTGNMSYLIDFKEFDVGYVTFGEGARGGRITDKGTLKTGKLDFKDVYFVKELQFNLFSDLQEEVFVSQPEGFEDQENPTHVYRLKRRLCISSRVPWIQ